MYRVDANAVGLGVPDGVALVNLVVGTHAELVFQGAQKSPKEVENQGITAMQNGAVVGIDQCREDDGFGAIFCCGPVDAGNGFAGLLIGLYEGQGDLHEFDIPELAQHAVTKGFRGNPGAVR